MNVIEEFLSVKEFAHRLNLHENTIRRSIKHGKIQAFRIGYGKKAAFRIPYSEISRIAVIDMEVLIQHIIDKRKIDACK